MNGVEGWMEDLENSVIKSGVFRSLRLIEASEFDGVYRVTSRGKASRSLVVPRSSTEMVASSSP